MNENNFNHLLLDNFFKMDLAWTRSKEEVLNYFNVEEDKGYSDAQVKAAQEKYGPNGLPAEEGKPLWKLILEQFDDLLVKILLGAALISFVLAFLKKLKKVKVILEHLLNHL